MDAEMKVDDYTGINGGKRRCIYQGAGEEAETYVSRLELNGKEYKSSPTRS